jgi:hyaluronoglucosaminidase
VAWAIRGLIEGFYGRPWSWDERIEVMTWCHERGMTHYLYAPKDDPLHRERWRERYPAEELAGFERLVESRTLQVGFGISPGLSIDYRSVQDRRALATKVDQLLAVGVQLVCLALDDIPPRPGLGEDHAALTTWLCEHVGDRASVVLVPTEYTGTASTPYLDQLASGVPPSVPIAWTGETVVCDEITAEHAAARAAALGGRSPLVWDNYPVNDAIMSDRLFLGPLRGRDPALASHCSGYVANPMVQPHASMLPLASTAAFLRGDDPRAAWREEAGRLGMSPFADACDGDAPAAMVDAYVTASPDERPRVLARIHDWLDQLEAFSPDGALHEELAPWTEQLKHEVGMWRAAIRTLRAIDDGDTDRATTEGLGLLFLWPRVRRGQHVVMGPRFGLRPVLGQWSDGSWRFDARSVVEDRNATDRLVRFALAQLDAVGSR